MKINLEESGTIKNTFYVAKINGNHIGDIYKEIGGFFYFEPAQGSTGIYSEEYLAALLFELQQLNAPWKETIRKYFDNEPKKDQV